MNTITVHMPYDTIEEDLLLHKIMLYNSNNEGFNNDYTEIDFNLIENNVDLYRKYTFNMMLNDVEEDTARLLALNWTSRRVISMYIQIDTIAFESRTKIPIYCYDAIFEYIRKHLQIYFDAEYHTTDFNLLGVLESSPNKGYHLHLLHLSTLIFNKKRLDHLLKYFEQLVIQYIIIPNNQEDTVATVNNDKTFKVLVNAEICKSVGGIFNYLQKKPLRVYVDSLELAKMFMYFKKEYIFPAGSQAKYQRLNKQSLQMSKDPLLILLYNFFNEGIYDYNDIIKETRIQPYLTKPHLKQIFLNAFQNFSASLNHIKNVILICNKYLSLPINQRCACPVLEFIEYQNIEINTFLEDTFKWLSCIQKKNCLWFFGPADCGKSHLARLIWKCFTLNTRIISDGIFSFANLLKSGCALWDEPFIGPDLADQTKLVLEGEADIDITIKNRGSERLGKRVPIIITSNSLLWKYCSGERVPFEQRTFQFKFERTIHNDYFCNETEHYCPSLDASHNTYNPFTSDGGIQNNKRRRSSETRVFNCEKNHPIEQHHVISYLILSLLRYKHHFVLFKSLGLDEDYQLLADKLKETSNTLCLCSKTLNIKGQHA